MDANTILQIRPALTRFLHQFDDCFARSQTRGHLGTYVQGQLGPLPRKSVEPIADAAGTPPRTLQEFMGLSRWDEAMMRDRLQQHVARHHAHRHSVGIFDETSFPKKGDQTACVQRQHCGAAGKLENCVVSKMELGMDHFEVRKFNAISRHLLLSCVSHLFLAEFQQQHLTAGEGGGKRRRRSTRSPRP
jgi:SRSO17 transposase